MSVEVLDRQLGKKRYTDIERERENKRESEGER